MVVCAGCERPILDRFLFNVLDRAWHAKCVLCYDCKAPLNEKCFSRDGQLYCREDFFRRFGTKCGGCSAGISPNDLVRRARNKVFHLKCFTCMVCRKQLSTGEELYVLDENKFICKEDYLNSKYSQGSDHEDNDVDLDAAMLDKLDDTLSEKGSLMGEEDDDSSSLPSSLHHIHKQNGTLGSAGSVGSAVDSDMPLKSPSEVKLETNNNDLSDTIGGAPLLDNKENKDGKGDESADEGGKKGSGQKRRGPRTTIKAKQLEVLKAAFNATPKPTRHIREQLASETGLNMRVIQVWFQNRRSKERRMKQLNALGARRAFFRNPRRMRGLGPDGDELMGPGFGYFENGDFYPGPGYPGGYPGNDFYPGEPAGMGFLHPNGGPQSTSPLVDQGGMPGMHGEYMHPDMLQHNNPNTGSPEPLPSLQQSMEQFGNIPPRSLPQSGFNHPLGRLQPDVAPQEAW